MNVVKIKETGRAILAEIDEMRSFARSWNGHQDKDMETFKPVSLIESMIKVHAKNKD